MLSNTFLIEKTLSNELQFYDAQIKRVKFQELLGSKYGFKAYFLELYLN